MSRALPDLKVHCRRCSWRLRVLANEGRYAPDGESDSEHDIEEFSNPVRAPILRGLHETPPPIWIEILNTESLTRGNIVKRPQCPFMWMRIPLRSDFFGFTTPAPGDAWYEIDGEWRTPHHIHGPVCHNTTLTSSVNGNEWTAAASHGILYDGGLQWGTRTHERKSGVNYYAGENNDTWAFFDDVPPENVENQDIALECLVTTGTKLEGSADSYCINRSQRQQAHGPICPFIGIRAILLPLSCTPACIRLT